MVEINNLTTVSIDTEFLEKIVQGILKEELSREVLVQKIIGVMLVSLGLWVLTIK